MTPVELHERLQRAITKLVARGMPAADVAEAAVTVAVANLVTVHGPRRASYGLLSAGAGLQALADQHEADVAAPRH